MTFPTIVLCLLNGLTQPLQCSLDRFFQTLERSPLPRRRVSKSAFCQARRKIAPTAFGELNTALLTQVREEWPLALWRGLRLLALDATSYRLPRAAELFQLYPPSGSDSYPSALSSTLYDALNGFILHAFLHAATLGERALALAHAPYLGKGDLLLFDRGYFGFWFFAWLRQRGVAYCTRATGSTWKPIVAFARSRRSWAVVTLRPCAVAAAQCRRYGLPLTPIRVRLIRVRTASGLEEILLTSLLNRRLFPDNLFPDLYHLRWGIEGCFRDLKSRFQLENFSGLSSWAVEQDFAATVLAFNLRAAFVHAAQAQLDAERRAPQPDLAPPSKPGRPRSRKRTYRINHTYAVFALQDVTVNLLSPSALPDRLVPDLLDLLQSNREIVRPNRSFVRKRSVRDRPVYYMKYKSPR